MGEPPPSHIWAMVPLGPEDVVRSVACDVYEAFHVPCAVICGQVQWSETWRSISSPGCVRGVPLPPGLCGRLWPTLSAVDYVPPKMEHAALEAQRHWLWIGHSSCPFLRDGL